MIAWSAALRVSREARITKLEEHAELAYQAAESGFNRVRSQAVRCGGNPASLDGHSETLTYTGESGGSLNAGSYSLTVSGTGPWDITSVGTYGNAPLDATRVIKGRISASIKKVGGVCQYYIVTTTYTP
jgi:hypothetical protein